MQDNKSKRILKSLIILIIILGVWYFFFFREDEVFEIQAAPVMTEDGLNSRQNLVICSQNLENYGELEDVKRRMPRVSKNMLQEKENALVKRFVRAKCDIVAVQEVMASSKKRASLVLSKLAAILSETTKRDFDAYVGESNDFSIRSGFLVAKDAVKLLNTRSYNEVELPKLMRGQRQRHFSRGPFEILLAVKSGDEVKHLKLINFHFKSRSGKSGRDPSGYDFETLRMEMAEALRDIAENSRDDELVILLGDRNDNFDTAAAKIVEGTLTLEHFQHGGACSISKKGIPLCENERRNSPEFVSALVNDPQMRYVGGTLLYRKRMYWLDDILLSRQTVPYALVNEKYKGDFDSGVVTDKTGASDHSLVWVRLYFEKSKAE